MLAVIPDDDTGRFHKAGFDRVIQAEVTNDPIKQSFLPAFLAGRGERSRGEIVSDEDVSALMDAV